MLCYRLFFFLAEQTSLSSSIGDSFSLKDLSLSGLCMLPSEDLPDPLWEMGDDASTNLSAERCWCRARGGSILLESRLGCTLGSSSCSAGRWPSPAIWCLPLLLKTKGCSRLNSEVARTLGSTCSSSMAPSEFLKTELRVRSNNSKVESRFSEPINVENRVKSETRGSPMALGLSLGFRAGGMEQMRSNCGISGASAESLESPSCSKIFLISGRLLYGLSLTKSKSY